VEIFSVAQVDQLRRLPELSLLRAEPDFDDLRLAVRALADQAALLEPMSVEAIERHLVTLLRRGREEAAISPERFVSLRGSIDLLATASRPRALFDIALFAVRLLPAYSKQSARLDRLLVASIAVRPGSTKQVTRWTARTPQSGVALAECEVTLAVPTALPVRSGGAQLF
jgi:hypothetical protein